ncbi:MAG: tetratricopeptide repeat protein [Dysgonamonadaceae bacterium]|jgi:tetratricopeptide (TPR) repeat protein|nr:tetratricopeptide repeat protein [Dysgonamonadaceae bacterium]
MKKSITQVLTIIFLFGAISMRAQDSIATDYLRKAQYQQAVEYMDAQAPTRDLLYQKALCYKWLNNYSKALEILETAQEDYPGDIPIQLELAQCYEANLQYLKSIRCYEKLMASDSTNLYFRVRKADLLYRAEKYTTALENYRQIDPAAYNPAYLEKSIALCYEKLNKPDSAQIHYQAAWEADAHDVFSILSLVKLCIQQTDYEQALQYSENFLARDTTNTQMNALNAFTYYNLGEYEEAIRRFEKCRAAGDSSLLVNRSLGISYFFLQNDPAAYPYLQQVNERDSTNTTVLYALASVQYNLQRYPESILLYQKLIGHELPNPNTLCTYYTGLAKACEKDSLYADADQNYKVAIRYALSNMQKMELYFNLSTLLDFQLKDYTQAVFYYTQYQATLLNYLDALQEKPDIDSKEIKSIELKINELNKYIRKLKADHGVNYEDKIWQN